jgi:hypothetical protein
MTTREEIVLTLAGVDRTAPQPGELVALTEEEMNRTCPCNPRGECHYHRTIYGLPLTAYKRYCNGERTR